MYNIPIVDKLRRAAELGDVSRVERILKDYDILIHPAILHGRGLLAAVGEPTRQIEFYELQLARYVSWTGQSLPFVERISNGDFRGRRLGFLGFDTACSVRRYLEARESLEDWYKRRYYAHKIKKGAAAAEAYRSGFLEAVLDRVRIPRREPRFYQQVFELCRFRDILPPSKRDLHDQAARSAGLDDGLVCELATLKYTYAKSLCGSLSEPGPVGEAA